MINVSNALRSKSLTDAVLPSVIGALGLAVPTILILMWGSGYEGEAHQEVPFQWLVEAWRWTQWVFPDWPKWVRVSVSDGWMLVCVGLMAWGYLRLLASKRFKSLLAPGVQGEAHPAGLPPSPLKQMVQPNRLWLLWVGVLVVLLTVVPFHSRDLYGYINRGAQQAVHHVNPYVVTVEETPQWEQDPLFQDHWVDNPSPYGFFFTGLTMLVVGWAGASSFVASFLGFKVVMALALAGTTWLIGWLSLRYRQGAEDSVEPDGVAIGVAKRNMLVFAWHPLVLLQAVGHGHNDILLGGFLLLAVGLAVDPRMGQRMRTLPVWIVSVLTKYASVLLGPWLVMAMVQRRFAHRWWILVGGIVFSLILIGLLAFPFVVEQPPWPLSQMLDNATMSQHSLHSALKRLVYYPVAWIAPQSLDGVMAWWQPTLKALLYMTLASVMGWRFWEMLKKFRSRSGIGFQDLVQDGVWVLGWLFLIASSKFHPWYLLMVLPLASVLPVADWKRQALFAVALVQLLAFTPLENLHIGSFIILIALPIWWARRVKASDLQEHPTGGVF